MASKKKKDFPLAVLEQMEKEIQPLLKTGFLVAHQIKDEQVIYHLIDNSEYDFFFKISQYTVDARGIRYIVGQKPSTKLNLESSEFWMTIKDLSNAYKTWIDIIDGYDKASFVHDDPIIKSYQAEFEKKFDIVDADADIAPFSLEQQLYLDNYLEHVKKQMSLLKAGMNDEEQKPFMDIESDAIQLQKDLTRENKRKIVKKLSKILAKAQKIGLEVFKKVAIDFLTEFSKKLLTGGL
ncbi:MAG TPA: hypothetical protein VNZ45_18170 [Bacteroidia bacterium]|jgi:hypothetical protein|nr:hypothetical protein [Bacteroidia bacterium]